MKKYETPKASFSVSLPGDWGVLRDEDLRKYEGEKLRKGAMFLTVPWLWYFFRVSNAGAGGAITINSDQLGPQSSYIRKPDPKHWLEVTLAYYFKRFGVSIETGVKDGYHFGRCEFYQVEKGKKRFYKLYVMMFGDKCADISYNCAMDDIGEEMLREELKEVNKIFDSFRFV